MTTISREAALLRDALDDFERSFSQEDIELEAFNLEPYDVPELAPARRERKRDPERQQPLDLD